MDKLLNDYFTYGLIGYTAIGVFIPIIARRIFTEEGNNPDANLRENECITSFIFA
jgi:hypothetical protein